MFFHSDILYKNGPLAIIWRAGYGKFSTEKMRNSRLYRQALSVNFPVVGDLIQRHIATAGGPKSLNLHHLAILVKGYIAICGYRQLELLKTLHKIRYPKRPTVRKPKAVAEGADDEEGAAVAEGGNERRANAKRKHDDEQAELESLEENAGRNPRKIRKGAKKQRQRGENVDIVENNNMQFNLSMIDNEQHLQAPTEEPVPELGRMDESIFNPEPGTTDIADPIVPDIANQGFSTPIKAGDIHRPEAPVVYQVDPHELILEDSETAIQVQNPRRRHPGRRLVFRDENLQLSQSEVKRNVQEFAMLTEQDFEVIVRQRRADVTLSKNYAMNLICGSGRKHGVRLTMLYPKLPAFPVPRDEVVSRSGHSVEQIRHADNVTGNQPTSTSTEVRNADDEFVFIPEEQSIFEATGPPVSDDLVPELSLVNSEQSDDSVDDVFIFDETYHKRNTKKGVAVAKFLMLLTKHQQGQVKMQQEDPFGAILITKVVARGDAMG